jgi:hypothetical protein
MIIRSLVGGDLEKLRQIHEKYFKEEFDFPDFATNFIGTFAILNNGKIITAGGVRTIAESVLITDLGIPVNQRSEALYKALDLSKYFCKINNYDQLHAFVQGDNWVRRLEKEKFHPCKGMALYTEVD